MSIQTEVPALSSVGVRELRQEASAILRRVKAGESVVVTEHGKPVAQIIPAGASKYEQWIARGLIRPAANPGGLKDCEPAKLPKGRKSLSVLLQEMRDEDQR